MDEKFEEQLSELLHYRSDPATPFSASDVITGARRRSRTRTLGVASSTLAVVAVGVGAAALAGNSPNKGPAISTAAAGPAAAVATTAAPAATTTTTTPSAATTTSSSKPAFVPSPVKTVAPGEKVTAVDGYQVWVTSHEKCASESAAFMGAPASSGDNTVCKDVTGSNMAWDGAGDWLSIQGSGTKNGQVLSGTFQGKTIPALIDVEQDGSHYPATILETAGMEQNHWVAYYVTFPNSSITLNRTPYTVTAYDANGKALTQSPPASSGK
ncbi:MAG: hypothetical protein HOV87_19020 [Catenulispora sp.]|nr:hypothetical protein [Catenulispora sp.]